MLNPCKLQQLYVRYRLLYVNPRNSPSSSNNCQIYSQPPSVTTSHKFPHASKQAKPQQNLSKAKPHTTSLTEKFKQPFRNRNSRRRNVFLQFVSTLALCFPLIVYTPSYLQLSYLKLILSLLRLPRGQLYLLLHCTLQHSAFPQLACSLLKIKERWFSRCYEEQA